MANGLVEKIYSLINKSNDTTGKTDTDLTRCIKSLSEGYGLPSIALGHPIEVNSASEMDAVLENADENTVGKVYRYTGETTDKYTNGELYIVEGAE